MAAKQGFGGVYGAPAVGMSAGIVLLVTAFLTKDSNFEGETLSYYLALFSQ